MTEKQWSYREITVAAEASIRLLMAKATKDTWESRFNRAAAWGVWYGWDRLTTGWQMENDSQRLEVMTL